MIALSNSDLIRFNSKIEKSETCWNWVGCIDDGYGKFSIGKRNYGAHVIAYTIKNSSIPNGLQIDHLCRNRRCVNHEHLEAVTIKVNVLRGEGVAAKNKKKTHCPAGHEYSTENTLIRKSGRRRCKQCTNEKQRLNYR